MEPSYSRASSASAINRHSIELDDGHSEASELLAETKEFLPPRNHKRRNLLHFLFLLTNCMLGLINVLLIWKFSPIHEHPVKLPSHGT